MARADGTTLGTVVALGVVTGIGAWLIQASYEWSRGRIALHERAELVARLSSVLDPALRGRDLTTTRIDATDEALLGTPNPLDAFVVTDGDTPVATVLSVVAPHGYNAAIELFVGIAPDGTITGVRTLRHRETPRLGDAIDADKSDWIGAFAGRSLAQPHRSLWAVRQDDGEFDAITGATATSRAVVAAVKNALLYFEQHSDELYAKAAAATSNDHDRTD